MRQARLKEYPLQVLQALSLVSTFHRVETSAFLPNRGGGGGGGSMTACDDDDDSFISITFCYWKPESCVMELASGNVLRESVVKSKCKPYRCVPRNRGYFFWKGGVGSSLLIIICHRIGCGC